VSFVEHGHTRLCYSVALVVHDLSNCIVKLSWNVLCKEVYPDTFNFPVLFLSRNCSWFGVIALATEHVHSNCVPVGARACARVLLCSLLFLSMCLLTSTVRALYFVHLVYMSLSSFPSSFSSFNLYKLNWYVSL
jgi:uncharacterized membrane protein